MLDYQLSKEIINNPEVLLWIAGFLVILLSVVKILDEWDEKRCKNKYFPCKK